MVDDKTVKLERFDKTAVYPELAELSQLEQKEQPKKKWSKRKKMAVIAGGFIFSFLLLFFMLAYYQDEQVIAEQKQMHQKQLAAEAKKQQALEQRAATQEAAVKVIDIKDKAENYLQDVNIPKKAEVQQTVNEAGKHVEEAVNAAQNDPKVQAALKDHSQLINQVTQFLEEQKHKLLAIFSQTKQKADKP